MFDSFIFSLNATMPVFLMMIVGYVLRRMNFINEPFANVCNKFVYKIALPCLLFLDIAETNIRENFDLPYVGFCFGVTIATILVVWAGAKLLLKDKSLVGEFVQASYRSSAAILGTAFILNIYGNTGLTPLMIIGSVPLYNIFAVLVLNLECPSSQKEPLGPKVKKALLGILKNPIIISIFLGLLASLVNLKLPVILEKTASNLAGLSSPLALIAIGATFEGKKALGKIKPAVAASLIKTVILPGVFLPAAISLGFRDQALVALVIMLGSPTTPTSFIMSKNMGHEGTLSSSCIVLTTLLSSVTITLWIFVLRYLGMIM